MTGNQNTIPDEHWKDIPGFPGYQASNAGRIRSFRKPKGHTALLSDTPHFLKFATASKGRYYRVCLCTRNPKRKQHVRLVHQLVLEAFVGPRPPDKPWCCHRDDDGRNNSLENLYWGTQADNARDRDRHGTSWHPIGSATGSAKLTEEVVAMIRKRINNGDSLVSIAKGFSVCKSTIYHIKKWHSWKHVQPA